MDNNSWLEIYSTPPLTDADTTKNPARDQTCPGWQGKFMDGWMDG